MCVDNMYQDKTGKLWLKSCGAAIQLSAHLFSFDGYKFDIAKGELSRLGNKVQLRGVINDTLYGYDDDSKMYRFFKMNLVNQNFEFYDSIPFQKDLGMSIDNDKVYQYNDSKNVLRIKIWEGSKNSSRDIDFGTTFGLDTLNIKYVKIKNDHLWIWDPHSFRFCTLNLITGNKSEIDVSEYFEQHNFTPKDLESMELKFTGEVINLKFSTSKKYFLKSFQLYFNQGVSVVEKFELDSSKGIHVFADEKSNLLYVYEVRGKNNAFIEVNGNVRIDASGLFKGAKINRIKNIIGDDFFREFYLCNDVGFKVVKLKLKEAIQKVQIPASLRSLSELPNQRLLINTQGRDSYMYDLKTGAYTKYMDPSCVSTVHILKERGDEYWSFHKNNFLAYNPKTNECKNFPSSINNLKVFDFYKNELIIGSYNDNNIVVFDIAKGSERVIEKHGVQYKFESVVHNVFVDSKDRIWFINAEGLHKLDLNTNEVKNITSSIEGFNFKLLSIAEGDNGDLWLGSSLSGLIILNPDTKEFTQVSSDQGLCNNTVASVTRDQNGKYWLGTYNGIALLDENGGLVTNFYEKDGLVNNECNRYSSKLLSDGKVAIGSIEGFTILNPEAILKNLYDQTSVNIYLTKADFLGNEDAQTSDHTLKVKESRNIDLLPQSRNLSLEFAVSNYIRPLENRYAYRIDAFHDDWIELGNKNSLELRDLSAGNYTLEIKGGDNLGNWSQNSLKYQIHAKEFFYKSWRFYFLILGMIISIALLWITSLRKQVKIATEEITEDKEIIEQQAKRLKELDEAKSDFFTNISHEFRTPLTIISGMIDQIRAKPDAWLDKGSQMIKENTINLLNLVNQILDLRKLETNNLTIRMVQGDIVPYIEYLVNSHKYLAELAEVKLSFESTEKELVMDYDPEKILRIVSNLLSNAIKFNKKNGQVNVELKTNNSPESRLLCITVQDTGRGISPSDIEGIFDRFYQVESEIKNSALGSGIGLSLTKQLLDLLGGTIDVNSIVGAGSIFTIQLPIRNTSQLKPATSRIELPIKTKTKDSTNPSKNLSVDNVIKKNEELPNLLIVEDNESIITLISAQLEFEYNISFQLNGDLGVKAAIAEVPDIIISDIMMPIKDGIQLCKELKADVRTSHIPIILLTAKTSQDSKLLGLEQKADVYLSKPFDPKELKLRMSNLLEIRNSLQKRFKDLRNVTAEKKSESPKEDAFVVKLRTGILKNIDDETFGVMQLCRVAGLSRSQLHNKVKALTGLSASNYIRSVRLQKARAMLQSSDMNVSEVAYAVGFNNPTYFSSSYTQEFGENPSKTRK